MIEILYLLLPLAFYSGWKAAKKNTIKQCITSNKLADDYVKGVNYLLSEKPDKALEVFINHPDVDEYTAETYLLLGNMFRNRGEVDRALRLHQNLMARSSLNKDQKSLVMFALGEDYLAAGMLDRAESVFQELQTSEPENVNACAPLRRIYEQTHEWEKAIEATYCSKGKKIPLAYQKLIAHYYCEMAEQQMALGKLHRVEEYLAKANKHYKESARVMILQADLLQRKKNDEQAFQLYLQAIQQDSRLLAHLSTKIMKIALRIGKNEELEQLLLQLYRKDSSVLACLLKLSLSNASANISTDFLLNDLATKNLDIDSIIKSISILQQQERFCAEHEKLSLIQQALENYLQKKASFQCQNCGYQMQDYLWRCPACYQWDVVSHT